MVSTPSLTIDPAKIAERLLPARKRQDVRALANGCYLIRQTILGYAGTESGCCSDAQRIIEMVRDGIEAIYERRPKAQGGWPMDEVLRASEVPKQVVMQFVDACEVEARTTRYATWDSLRRHCDGVGGNVAVMMSCVLGLTHSDVRGHAIALGRAVRLIGILHQLKTDVARGRIYLPLEDLARCRYAEKDLLAGVVDERFRAAVAIQTGRARDAMKTASAALCWLGGDGARLAVATYVSLQLALLDAIERADLDLFTTPPALTPARALRRLPGAWRLARRQPDEALPRI